MHVHSRSPLKVLSLQRRPALPLAMPTFLLASSPRRRYTNFAFTGDGETSRTWFFSFTFALVCVTIVSGSLAERTHLAAYPAITVVIATLVHPIMVHWAWSEGAWIDRISPCKFQDFAGGTLVHVIGAHLSPGLACAMRSCCAPAFAGIVMSSADYMAAPASAFAGSNGLQSVPFCPPTCAAGGLMGLIGAYMCGPRLGRFEDGAAKELPGHDTTFVTLGELAAAPRHHVACAATCRGSCVTELYRGRACHRMLDVFCDTAVLVHTGRLSFAPFFASLGQRCRRTALLARGRPTHIDAPCCRRHVHAVVRLVRVQLRVGICVHPPNLCHLPTGGDEHDAGAVRRGPHGAAAAQPSVWHIRHSSLLQRTAVRCVARIKQLR